MKNLLIPGTLAPLPDLSRTKAAIEAYDAFEAQFEAARGTQDEALAMFEESERLGRAVGHAYGLDTADRNNLVTCAQCIRPGPRVPGPGCELSFVRRMVAKWEARKHEGD